MKSRIAAIAIAAFFVAIVAPITPAAAAATPLPCASGSNPWTVNGANYCVPLAPTPTPAPTATPTAAPTATPAPAAATPSAYPAIPPTIAQGVYEACGPVWVGLAACEQDLDVFAASGYNVVINYNLINATASDMVAYVNYAASKGITAYVPIAGFEDALYNNATQATSSPAAAYTSKYANDAADFPWTSTCAMSGSACATIDDAAGYVTSILGTKPHVYTFDEPLPIAAANAAIAEISSDVLAVNPNAVRLGVLGYWNVNNQGSSTTCPQAAYTSNMAAYNSLADIVGPDAYLVAQANDNGSLLSTLGPLLGACTSGASAANKKPSVAVVQAYSVADYGVSGAPYPTTAQIAAETADFVKQPTPPALILYFSSYNTWGCKFSGCHGLALWNVLQAARGLPPYTGAYPTSYTP